MSRSRNLLLAGVLVALVLGALIVVGTALEQWVVAALGVAGLLAAIFAVQLDSWRRLRAFRALLRKELRASGGDGETTFLPSGLSTVTHDDVVGAVRLMQAQYTGRLDRMQTTLERALAELPTTTRTDAGS